MKFRHAVAAITALLVMHAAAAQTAAPAKPATAPAPAATAAKPGANPATDPATPGMPTADAATTPAPGGATTALKPGDATAGQGKAAACGACHGPDGNSTDAQYPRLAGQSEQYIAAQLADFKSGKRNNPIMAGFAAPLSEQDMHDIGAYFASKTSLPGVADQALVKQGESLYRMGDAARGVPACMACHGPDGRGNPGAHYPQVASQHAAYVEARLKAFHDADEAAAGPHAKIMITIAQKLSDKDMAAVASFIEGLHTNEPGSSAAPATP
ncbi:c-type cytochrome [Luteibacter sp. 329MFSha]|uniref:c-type cytochrome n=1 Tax=Luteibacter sp. 329MFSha TaxID=1798239 RepID=UPI0008D77CDD|nr:c-type cytochrome [Luteibacter sp. 329MFSha]SEW12609.1 Cytochrome c553 [Luteibacter sp. 329MFSha]